MRKRYLMEECKKCVDNDKTLSFCCECCGISFDLLEYIEESNKVKERLLEANNDKSQH